jgi:hypothetical protein
MWGQELKDDATLLLIEYRGQGEGQGELPVMSSGLRD